MTAAQAEAIAEKAEREGLRKKARAWRTIAAWHRRQKPADDEKPKPGT